MKNPPHPGGGLRHDIEAMGWTVAECARRLGVSRASLSRVLNGKQGITPAIAFSLERLGWSDAETWMRLQATYDLAQEALEDVLADRVRSHVEAVRGKLEA